jgi:threonine dehydratase
MSPLSPLMQEISKAGSRIYSIARRTPADPSPGFSMDSGAVVHFKLENLQYTGSFKLRGITNKLLSLDDAARKRGCVVASTGNHGAAAAYAFSRLGITGEIFVPEKANPSKVDAIKRLGGNIRFHGTDPGATETHARRYAADRNMVYISPYNDPEVVAGQGTVCLELLEQVPDLGAVFVAVGGGGLISGIGACIKRQKPQVRVIGCLPENSPVMLRSVEAGKVIDCDCRPTLSDGTAGNMDHDSITLDICRQVVDQWILVTEEEIRAAMRRFIEIEHMLLEGAAGVAVAGFERSAADFRGENVAVVICGRNLDIDTLRTIL